MPTAIGVLTSAGSLGAASIPTSVGWIADRVGLEVIPLLLLGLAIVLSGLHYLLLRCLSPAEHSPLR